jgi:hypothetical protein
MWFSMGTVRGSCTHRNEPSGSIKAGEFLASLRILVATQEGLKLSNIAAEWLGCQLNIIYV